MPIISAINPSNTTVDLITDASKALKVDLAGASHGGSAPTTSTESVLIGGSGTGNSSAIDTTAFNVVGIAFSSSNTTDPISIQASIDSVSYFTLTQLVYPLRTIELSQPAFKFYRASQTDTTGIPSTLNITVSKRYLI